MPNMKTKDFVTKIGLAFVFVSGIVLSLLIPPFQKPDEYTHFNRTSSLSVGVSKCSTPSGNVAMVPQNYLDLQEEMHKYGLEHHDFAKFPYKIYAQSPFAPRSSFTLAPINIDATCALPYLSYLPQAFMLRLTAVMGLNPYVSFFAGRLGMFLLSFIWLSYIIKKSNHKRIILFTAMLPIVLHQLGSYGYDVIHIMLGLSIFAYLLHLREQKSFTTLDLGKLIILIIALMLVKPGYEIFILLPLLFLPWKKMDKSWTVPSIGLLAFGSLVMVTHIYSTFFNVSRVTTSLSIPYTFPALQLEYLITHPLYGIDVLMGTTTRTVEEYAKQMIGKFGWLDYWLSPFIYPLYFAIFGYLVGRIKLAKEQILSVERTILLALWIFAQYALVMLSVYLVWTTTGSAFVEGIQGRYFIILVPFIIYLAVNIINHRVLRNLSFAAIIIAIFMSMITRTTSRYYDYSELFRESALSTDDTYVATVPDDQSYHLDMSSYQGGKIGGLLIGLRNPSNSTTHPYLLRIKDSGCNKVLREQFIPLDGLSGEYYKATFKPLKVEGNSSLCITIAPYKTRVGPALQMMTSPSGDPAIAPLILR